MPVTANQAEVNPALLAVDVAVPSTSAAAMIAKPPAPTGRTPSSGGLGGPAVLRLTRALQPLPDAEAQRQPSDQWQHPDTAGERVQALDVEEELRHREREAK